MNETAAPLKALMENELPAQPLPWGPMTIIVTIIIAAFVLLTAYSAWVRKEKFEMPARDFVAMLIVILFGATVFYTFYGKLNEGGDILLGALIAAFSAVVALYFRYDKGEKP